MVMIFIPWDPFFVRKFFTVPDQQIQENGHEPCKAWNMLGKTGMEAIGHGPDRWNMVE